MASTSPQSPDQFEDYIKDLLEKNYDYEVIKPPKGMFGYDIEIINNGKPIAVQVKKYRTPVNRAHIQKFMGFMGLHHAESQFSEGWLISSSGFSKPAIEHLRNESRENPRASVVSLGTIYQSDIRWDYLDPKSSFHTHQDSSREISLPVSSLEDYQNNIHRRYYFGIFTNKGGTGKTTVAAHLAGAFTLMGYDVILVDIDPQKNLKKLFQEDQENKDDLGAAASLYVQPLRPGQIGSVISVLDNKEWEDDKDNHNDIKIVICDCNPTFEENSNDLVKEFDYCVIPTTLNPLGIAKNSDVIKRTFEKIRTENSRAQMHVLINHYVEHKSKEKKNNLLLDLLKEQIDFNEDNKSYLIDPSICAIHRSDSLYYWGMHIVEKKKPQLGFELSGGKCVPREDFLKLAEYFRGKF
ncbi:nucleotide-binding protein [Candidatus Synechococcus spongiarum]|uniref:CobQ/CobB/MinD/ParA nucleotide binding domain-containing protein n=1 Tax=Candidatus Synechococcus spongiarum TaxID=431041 RepID=A0A165B2P5_9SYNE|nr:restriction endonuclease [Candidatus Synechococcus spongiarum]SAY38922.1 hypothetical protein FLM9_947 [Candidatus Synechococcus spongiarum]